MLFYIPVVINLLPNPILLSFMKLYLPISVLSLGDRVVYLISPQLNMDLHGQVVIIIFAA